MFADLHLHSPYALSTSQKITIPAIIKTAKQKGIELIASADCLHPYWREHLRQNLKEIGDSGFYFHQDFPEAKVVLSGEISFVFRREGRVRRVHILFLFYSFQEVERVAKKINDAAKLNSEGRPILKIDPYNFLNWLNLEKSIVIPAHIWTPWYSLLGAKSGFNSPEELFRDLTFEVDAYETGLSADPLMCGFFSKLDQRALVSNSDAHSLDAIGREFTEFPKINSFMELKRTLKTKSVQKTFEYFPQHGKYYFDGHRRCEYRASPEEATSLGEKCPVCARQLIKGVLHRVKELADREISFAPSFSYHIPLKELITVRNSLSRNKLQVDDLYQKIIARLESEIYCLHFAKIEQIAQIDEILGQLIERMRAGKINWQEGYDGLYGRIVIN